MYYFFLLRVLVNYERISYVTHRPPKLQVLLLVSRVRNCSIQAQSVVTVQLPSVFSPLWSDFEYALFAFLATKAVRESLNCGTFAERGQRNVSFSFIVNQQSFTRANSGYWLWSRMQMHKTLTGGNYTPRLIDGGLVLRRNVLLAWKKT